MHAIANRSKQRKECPGLGVLGKTTLPPMNRFPAFPFLVAALGLVAQSVTAKPTAPVAPEVFEIEGHRGLLYAAPGSVAQDKPWVWYAPTLKGLSLAGRKLYYEGCMGAGIAIAGFDLGEVRGSPASTAKFTLFYEEMVRRGYSRQPLLLGQSRGGLMMLAWAVRNPDKLRAFIGIYPVCNLASWPLQRSKAATLADYGLPEPELVARLAEFNPIDHLEGLLARKVPVFIVHGDADVVVPYADNTRILQERYAAGGGPIAVKIIPGEGHKETPSFFECGELLSFLLDHAR